MNPRASYRPPPHWPAWVYKIFHFKYLEQGSLCFETSRGLVSNAALRWWPTATLLHGAPATTQVPYMPVGLHPCAIHTGAARRLECYWARTSTRTLCQQSFSHSAMHALLQNSRARAPCRRCDRPRGRRGKRELDRRCCLLPAVPARHIHLAARLAQGRLG